MQYVHPVFVESNLVVVFFFSTSISCSQDRSTHAPIFLSLHSTPSVCIPHPSICVPYLDTACCWHIDWIGNYSRLKCLLFTLQHRYSALLIQPVPWWFSSNSRQSKHSKTPSQNKMEYLEEVILTQTERDWDRRKCVFLCVLILGALIEGAHGWECF